MWMYEANKGDKGKGEETVRKEKPKQVGEV